MKTLLILGLLVLTCFLSHSSSSPVGLELLLMDGCCPQSQKINIPKTKVKRVEMTPNGCRTKAIIVTTWERKFCLDPDYAPAKKLLQKFEESLSVSPKP